MKKGQKNQTHFNHDPSRTQKQRRSGAHRSRQHKNIMKKGKKTKPILTTTPLAHKNSVARGRTDRDNTKTL
jgi:hypothetical protein